jgi:hypothetical protein
LKQGSGPIQPVITGIVRSLEEGIHDEETASMLRKTLDTLFEALYR